MIRFLICLFILFPGLIAAQPVLEQTYNHSGTYTELAVSGTKFFVMDVAQRQCRIYNTDHSLFRVIDLDVPANNYLYDIRYVSEGLFAAASELSLAYIYYSYNTQQQFYTYHARIIREDGSLLADIPGARYLEVLSLDDGSAKLLAYTYDFSQDPYTVQTLVYSLPGDGSTRVSYGGVLQNGLGDAYPNPSVSQTLIPVSLPADITRAEIRLSDSQGRVLQVYHVDGAQQQLLINTASFPAGTYFYQLIIPGGMIYPAKSLQIH